MQRRRCNSLEWLEFNLLARIPNITHAVSTRQSTTNFRIDVNDTPLVIANTLEPIKRILDIPKMVLATQCHGTTIATVDTELSIQPHCDALTTKTPGIGLIIKHSDCQATIFYDPVNHAITNVHSGWRGNVGNIYAKTVTTMEHLYNSKAKDLIVCISPSLGPSHFEFKGFRETLPQEFQSFKTEQNMFDFWAIAHWQLTECGILPNNIEIARLCTFEHSQDFFSFRRNATSKRNITIVALR